MTEVVSIHTTNTVSPDPESQEAKLSRQIQTQQLQAAEDTRYDLQVERFQSMPTQIVSLTSVLVVASLFFAASFVLRKK